VLRLSRGMTYKAAIGELPYGGGKSVIIADSRCDKTRALLHAMGRIIEGLGIAPRDPAFCVRGRQVDDRASARQDSASGQIIQCLVPVHCLLVRQPESPK
jgi:hypothetical protein